jgi:hypothetical protein
MDGHIRPPASGGRRRHRQLPAVLDNISLPLIRDETAAPYAALLAHIIAKVQPHGLVEYVCLQRKEATNSPRKFASGS